MAPSLYIFWGPTAKTVVPLSDREILLGRSPECDIVIPFTAVSRQHARIRCESGTYVIEDMQSHNATFVNAQAILVPTPLRNNDCIRIDDFTATFRELPLTEADWLSCKEPAWMLTALWDNASARKCRLVAVAVCRQLKVWRSDPCIYEAVETAELCADERVGDEERARAEVAIREFQADIRREMGSSSPLWLLEANDQAERLRRALAHAQFAEWAVSRRSFDPRDMHGRLPADEECWVFGIENGAFAEILCEVFGNPFHPSLISPLSQTPDVIALANSAYENRELPSGTLDREHLGILADALEEAGCMEQSVLEHLRGASYHVRGCWALDLILGK
jgi:hypothetical protein